MEQAQNETERLKLKRPLQLQQKRAKTHTSLVAYYVYNMPQPTTNSKNSVAPFDRSIHSNLIQFHLNFRNGRETRRAKRAKIIKRFSTTIAIIN